MSKINLFYLSGNTTGGWVTFTVHLVAALKAAGHEPIIRKIGNNSEKKSRPFGYGLQYWNTSPEEAQQLALDEKCLIVAAAKNFYEHTKNLVFLGASLVVHDPTELKNIPLSDLDETNTVVIRKAALEHLPFATLIKHPYERQVKSVDFTMKSTFCVSTSRIDFDKHTEILLDANRLLEPDRKIQIHGFENRLYTRFKICPNYPEWEQSKVAYPREKMAALDILKDAYFMADMSLIKGDGGGTQYTTLESWDAGCIPIIQQDWTIEGDEMVHGYNCLTVSSAENIVHILCQGWDYYEVEHLIKGGYESLSQHDPELIGHQYSNFLKL